MNSQKQLSTRSGSKTDLSEIDPWLAEDGQVLEDAGVLDVVRKDRSSVISFQDKAAQLRGLRDLVLRPNEAINLLPTPVSAVKDTRLKIDPSVSLLAVTVLSISSVLGMGIYMMNQNPNAQLMKMQQSTSQQMAQLSSESMNANAAIADRAVTEAGTDLAVCLWGCGGEAETKPTEPETFQAETVSNPVSSAASVEQVATVPSGSTLNIRSEPNGKVVNTIPSGDRLSVPAELSSDRKWAKVTWLESNLSGWVSYGIVYPLYR
jgi:hypothetical protein